MADGMVNQESWMKHEWKPMTEQLGFPIEIRSFFQLIGRHLESSFQAGGQLVSAPIRTENLPLLENGESESENYRG